MLPCKRLLLLFFFGLGLRAFSQTTQIEFNTTSPCPTGQRSPCGASDNRVNFYVTTQNPDPVSASNPNILPRFKAFWITGDGNYWEFPDTDTDAESRNPSTSYNYAQTGDYLVSAYLTGKYTNRHPPPGAARQITVPNVPPPPPTGDNPNAPTPFHERPGSQDFDFFPVHEIRKDYLIPFVLSYPARLDSTWAYLFFNGRPNGTNWPERPLVYRKSPGIVPKYYNGDSTRINVYPTSTLANEISFDDLSFVPSFASLRNRYSDVLYFPLEKAPSSSMPAGFTKKRYFPVFWANKDVAIGAADSIVSFCYIVTGPRPVSGQDMESLRIRLSKAGFDLPVSSPITALSGFQSAERLQRVEVAVQQGPVPQQYIQGFYSGTVDYVAAHDPNQLTVQKIEAMPDGNYLVTFDLEMCNKGGGRTDSQYIDLHDRFGRFHDFKFMNAPVPTDPANRNHYFMKSALVIPGIPESEYEMMCRSVQFTAVTNCEGVRSLWAGADPRAFEVCVRFAEVSETECGDNLPIDSCSFKIDQKCPCTEDPVTCGGDGWFLTFLLLFVFVLLVWKYYFDKANM